MGKVLIQNGVVKVVDAWMVKQRNSGAETEMDGDHLATLLYQKREVPGAMTFWWHSHANMGVFWSSTDRDQIAKLASNGLCVALVLNVKGEHLCLIATGGSNPSMHTDGVTLEIDAVADPEKKAAWDKEYEENVLPPAPVSYYGHYNKGYWDDDWGDSRWSPQSRRWLPEDREAPQTRAEEAPHDEHLGALKRIKELDQDLEDIEDAITRDVVTFALCRHIDVNFEVDLELDSPVNGLGRKVTIYELALEKREAFEKELQELIDDVRGKS